MLYQDGRQMCKLCRRTAVMSTDDIAPIEKEVKRIFAAFTLDVRNEVIPVRLVRQDEIPSIREDGTSQIDTSATLGMAFCASRIQEGKATRFVKEILVLYGLPAEHFAEVLAHEYGHAWMWLTGYPDLPEFVEEGMCELFAWIWLKSQRTPEATYRLHLMENNPHPDYGNGFRAANVQFKKHRLLALLNHVKVHRRFPS